MESLDQSKEKELKDKRLANRLRLATTRVKDAERERIWAIAQAHAEGLSIRTTSYSEGKDGFATNVKRSSSQKLQRSPYHLNSIATQPGI